MFGFEQGSSIKSVKKSGRRLSLADRTSSHRNDENLMPPVQHHAGSGVGSKVGASLQTQAFLQVAINPAIGAHTATTPAPPPATPRRGVRTGATTQIVENLEFKRRLQELESVARGAERENAHLQRLAKQAQDAADSAKARATAESARASAEKERADAARADVQTISAQVEAESARANEEKKRAEEATEEVKKAIAIAKAKEAQTREEKERADRATAAAAAAMEEAVVARSAAEAASLRIFVEVDQAKNAVAREKAKAEESYSRMSLLCHDIEALATHALGETPAKVNLREWKERRAASRANGGVSQQVCPSSEQLRDIDGDGDDDVDVARMKFIQGFCKLVETATGRKLPCGALHRLWVVKSPSLPPLPPPCEGGKDGCQPGAALRRVSMKGTEEEVGVTTATTVAPVAAPSTACNAAVPASPITPAVIRSKTNHKECLSVRKVKKDKKAQRVEEDRSREKVEASKRQKKRKKEAARQKVCIEDEVSASCVDGAKGVSPQASASQVVHLEPEQQKKENNSVATLFKSKRAKLGDSIQPQTSRGRQQQQGRKTRGQGKGLATNSVAVAGARIYTERKSATEGTSERLVGGLVPRLKSAAVGNHDEVTVEEVPMPTGGMDGEFFCGGNGYGVQCELHQPNDKIGCGALPVDEVRRVGSKPGIDSSKGITTKDDGTVKPAMTTPSKQVERVAKNVANGKRRTRSMRPKAYPAGEPNSVKDHRSVEKSKGLDDRARDTTPGSAVSELALANRCSSNDQPRKIVVSRGTTSIVPFASGVLSSPISARNRGYKASSIAIAAEGGCLPAATTPRRGPATLVTVDAAATTPRRGPGTLVTVGAAATTPRRGPATLVTVGSRFGTRSKRFRFGAPTLLSGGRAVPSLVPSEGIKCGTLSVPTRKYGGITFLGDSFTHNSRKTCNAVLATGAIKSITTSERVGVLGVTSVRPPRPLSPPLLPFGDDSLNLVDARGITGVARTWLDGAAAGGPGGVLTGVLAAGQIFMEKCHPNVVQHARETVGRGPRLQMEVVQCLRLLVTAIVATESCAMKHEARARTEAAVLTELPMLMGSEKRKSGDQRERARKRVKFCAFDLSTVDMPCEAIQGSEVPAREVADCLARVVDSSMILQEALQKVAPRKGRGGAAAVERQDGFAVWRAFLRGVRTVSVAPVASSALVEAVKTVCLDLGGEASTDTITRAAILLLDELIPLERDEASVKTPLRMRLASFLSALVRFNLRMLLNPPPPRPPVLSLYSTSAVGTDHSKVYQVIQLTTDKTKPQKRDDYDPTRDGATSAAVSRALRRLYGYSDEGAVRVISAAEAFVEKIKTEGNLSADDVASLTRQHSLATVDVVAAIRARGFMLELLEFPGVEEAIAEAQGWGEVERLSATLRKVRDCPDADAALSLLADVQDLKRWLGTSSPWSHGERAKAVLTKLDMVLVSCDKKEAKRLSQEARRRMWFPRVKAASSPETEAA